MANEPDNPEIEIWKPVYGYEAFYEVSSHGRVRSLDRTTTFETVNGPRTRTRRGKIRPLQDSSGRYLMIALRDKAGSVKGRTVHSLVCEAFHGPRPAGMQVSHLNGDGRDNRPANLRWESPKQNTGRKKQHGTQTSGEVHHSSILNEDGVRAIRLLRRAKMPIKQIANALRVSPYAVIDVLSGRTWAEVR